MRLRRIGLVALLSVSGATYAPGAPAVSAEPAPAGCRWRVVPTPAVPDALLEGASATSKSDVWAVGHPAVTYGQPINIHWDGRRWTIRPQEHVPGQGQFYDVVAISPTDAWAVGYQQDLSGVGALAMHWDGTIWRIVPTPDLDYAFLYGVAATSSTDVWAVGFYDAGSADVPLVLHWDGGSWRKVPAPGADSSTSVFNGVHAFAPDDVWAVGYRETAPFDQKPLIEHWDGRSWRVIPSPVPPGGGDTDILYSVSGVSPNDIWTVGVANPKERGGPLIEHWDGSGWRIVPPPSIAGAPGLIDVEAISGSDVWAVGAYTPVSDQRPYSLHWDGSRWNEVLAPYRGLSSTFFAVTAASAHHIWAVGTSTDARTGLLTEHSFGCS